MIDVATDADLSQSIYDGEQRGRTFSSEYLHAALQGAHAMKLLFLDCSCALAALMALVPSVALGQADPDSVKRQNDCRLAAQVIETRHPALRAEWAWQQIGSCAPAVQVRVLAAAMQQVRNTTDVAAAERALLPAVWFRDRALFETLLDIAADGTASTPARVVAFVGLAAIRNPSAAPSYDRFIGGVDEHAGGVVVPRARCSARIAHDKAFQPEVTDFPADYIQRIDAIRMRVAHDRSEPADVRSAAACV